MGVNLQRAIAALGRILTFCIVVHQLTQEIKHDFDIVLVIEVACSGLKNSAGAEFESLVAADWDC